MQKNGRNWHYLDARHRNHSLNLYLYYSYWILDTLALPTNFRLRLVVVAKSACHAHREEPFDAWWTRSPICPCGGRFETELAEINAAHEIWHLEIVLAVHEHESAWVLTWEPLVLVLQPYELVACSEKGRFP